MNEPSEICTCGHALYDHYLNQPAAKCSYCDCSAFASARPAADAEGSRDA